MRTRKELEEEFEVDDNGIILDPGRYESEPLYTPYFHDIVLDGGGEDQFDEDANLVTSVDVEEKDIEEFPELDGIHKVRVWESEQGFVYCRPEYTLKKEPEDDYE